VARGTGGSQAGTPQQMGGVQRANSPRRRPRAAGPSGGTERHGAAGVGADWEETAGWQRLQRLHLGRDPPRNGEQAPMCQQAGGEGEGRYTPTPGMQRWEGEPLALI